MKNIKHIYCCAMTLAFSISFAQPTAMESATGNAGKATISTEQNESIALNERKTNTSLDPKEEEPIVKPEVKIYPEPFEGIVSVNLNKCPDAQICVFDAKGNCLKYQKCENEECAIFNLRNQPKGIYYMEIKVKNEKTVKAIYLQQKF